MVAAARLRNGARSRTIMGGSVPLCRPMPIESVMLNWHKASQGLPATTPKQPRVALLPSSASGPSIVISTESANTSPRPTLPSYPSSSGGHLSYDSRSTATAGSTADDSAPRDETSVDDPRAGRDRRSSLTRSRTRARSGRSLAGSCSPHRRFRRDPWRRSARTPDRANLTASPRTPRQRRVRSRLT